VCYSLRVEPLHKGVSVRARVRVWVRVRVRLKVRRLRSLPTLDVTGPAENETSYDSVLTEPRITG